MTQDTETPALSKSAAKKLAAKQAKEAKKAETQARFSKQAILNTPLILNILQFKLPITFHD